MNIDINGISGGFMTKKYYVRLLCGLAAVFWSAVAAAEAVNTLKDITFASLPGGRFEVQMKFDAPPVEPARYEIDKPARIILDFAGVKNDLASKKFPLPFENAQSAVVLGGEDRTRLILNMTTLDVYRTRIDGNNYLVEVGGENTQDVLTSKVTFADKQSSDIQVFDAAITAIDFRRGETGEGRVLIDLSKSGIAVNVEQTSKEIKIKFAGTKLPVDLRRKLDVVDFATPVLSVSSSFDGKDTLVSIQPQGEYDYLAYQADKQYVVSVKKLTVSEAAEKKAKFAFVGEKLSLNFQDIPVRSVLQIIADFTELNLVASDTVSGKITLRLDNVPWDQALELVLKTKGLDKRQVGNVLMIAPAEEIAEQERKQLESQRQLQELAPMRTEYVRILYANAADLFKLFATSGGKEEGSTRSILSERGSAIVDSRTNSIVLTETEQKIAEFRSLIKSLDVPVRQVSIEARLVRASTNFQEDLGVSWFAGTNNTIAGGGTEVDAFGSTVLAAGIPSSVFTFGLLDSSDGDFIDFAIGALSSRGKGEVVSQPKVVTQDKREALIESGKKIPYFSSNDDGNTEIDFEDAVLRLKVTPYITPNDRILMDVEITKDAVGAPINISTNEQALPIDTTLLTTQVLVDNGQTIVIGGILEEERSESVSKVPVLGDIPFVGRLFRNNSESVDKIELLVFLTPRILSDPLARD
jgi:type IV pilus assembly protein PilQ